jgi:hypothetical protein
MRKKFKGDIVPNLIKKFHFSKHQAKKLICVISLCDGYGEIYPKRSEWKLETKPNNGLHFLVHDLFLYVYNINPPSGFRKSGKLQYTEIKGRCYEDVLKDLFEITPTFKTCPSKRRKEDYEEFFKKPQPTFKFLFEEPKWFKEIAMRIIFDLEGSIVPRVALKKKIYKNKRYFQFQFETFLSISLTHPSLLNQLQQLLSILGFHFNFIRDTRTWSKLGGIMTWRKEDISHFLQIGGFLTDVKVSKSKKNGIYNNNSFFKQALLKCACEILSNYATSKHFPTEFHARKYMKFFMEKIFIPYRDKFQQLEERKRKNSGAWSLRR